jgi:trk system potassium uptake protein TrkH
MPDLLHQVWRRMNAGQLAILSFGTVILVGALVLMLPVSNTRGLGFIDALFTSTSAVCVTGLIVVDTGTAFTPFGQGVILFLIQVGGFGIMTFGTFILFMLGGKAPFPMSDAASGSFLKLRRYSLSEMLSRALVLTLSAEAGGAILLFSRWVREYPLQRALWLSVFHSVSAFCNAGFSLFPDSLMGYAGDLTVNFTIMVLIVLGGIGFFVLIDLWDTLKRDPDPAKRRVSFHTKIVFSMTLLLIFGGAAVLYGLEQDHFFARLPFGQAAIRALFQSVSARTAGYNTIDIGRLSDASLFMLILLMFIGAAPGSMAGGVKVTTAGVILIVVLSRLRNISSPSAFGRSVSRGDLEHALSLILLSMFLIGFIVLNLLISEANQPALGHDRRLFMELLFESVSAFGTVGLSTGITSSLNDSGRLLITMLMFIGRLGPLTLVFALERRRAGLSYKYPEEKIMIG